MSIVNIIDEVSLSRFYNCSRSEHVKSKLRSQKTSIGRGKV